MATSSAACAIAGLPAGPAGVLAGALAGAAIWASGSVVANAAERAVTTAGPRSP
jgi:hypothetical protein